MCVVDYFNELDSKNRPVPTERERFKNLEALVVDAEDIPVLEVGIFILSFGILFLYRFYLVPSFFDALSYHWRHSRISTHRKVELKWEFRLNSSKCEYKIE